MKHLHCLAHGKHSINVYSCSQSTNPFLEHIQEGTSFILMVPQICEDISLPSFLSQLKCRLPREYFLDHPPERYPLFVTLFTITGVANHPSLPGTQGFPGMQGFLSYTQDTLGKLGKISYSSVILCFCLFLFIGFDAVS